MPGVAVEWTVARLRGVLKTRHRGPGRDPVAEARDDRARGGAARREARRPVTVQWLAEGDVFDRSALFRTPKIYKPGQVSDWRGEARKTITVMEALLEWPKFGLGALGGIVTREIKNARRRKKLAATDR